MYFKPGFEANSIKSNISQHLEMVQFQVYVQNIQVTIIFLYRSQQHPLVLFKDFLYSAILEHKDTRNLIIIGDVNTQDNIIEDCSFKQLIESPTTSGINGSTIDHAYVKLSDFKGSGHVLYKSFIKSYHHPICLNLTKKI